MTAEDNVSEDPEVWLPDLIRETWQPAIDELVAEGRDIALKTPPRVAGGSEVKAGGNIQGQLLIKVYEDQGEDSTMGSWNDSTEDTTMGYVIQAQYQGPGARAVSRAARRVIERILFLHRDHPHPDWHRFDTWSFTSLEAFASFQRFAVNLRIARYGVLIPKSLKRTP